MYSVDEYVKQTIMFTKSLVIKSLGAALAINRQVLKETNKSPGSNKATWKYFLNLAGERHVTNKEVEVYVIEKGTKEPLTKALLEKYPYTKKELLNNGDYYKDLVNSYPTELLYIHGCLYPVDIQKAISAPDGTILAYNTKYVEYNEYSLMKDLDNFCRNYFRRWYIREYGLVDELYVATMLANLYVTIPNKIINLRLARAITSEVHSFHLENFFRSTLDIWDDIQILSPATIMWLYKNLRYLKNNIGKNEILDTVINKIFNENNVGLGSYVIRTEDIGLLNTNVIDSPMEQSVYRQGSVVLSTTKLNNYYDLDNNKTIDTESILNLELELLKTNTNNLTLTDRDKYVVDNAVETINNVVKDKQETKIIEISSSKLFKMYGSDIYKVILDHWMYFVKYNKIEYSIEYIDPNTNKIYIINPRVALLLLIKYLLYLAKTPDLKVDKVYYSYVLNPDVNTLSNIYKKFHQDGLTDVIVNLLTNVYPNADKYISSTLDCSEFIKSLINFYTISWVLDANSSATNVSSNIKHLLTYASLSGEYLLTDVEGGESIDDILAKENILIDVNDEYDILDAINTLIKVATGVEIENDSEIDNTTNSYINLLNKLTSYTVQVVTTKTEEEKIFLYYNNSDVYRTLKGILQIINGYLVPIDQAYVKIDTLANAFVDEIKAEVINDDAPTVVMGEEPIAGYALLINCTYLHTDVPMIVELYDYPVIDVADLDYKDNFLIAAKGRITPIDPAKVGSGGTYNVMKDSPTTIFGGKGNDVTNEAKFVDETQVAGYGFFFNTNFSTIDIPLTVEID